MKNDKKYNIKLGSSSGIGFLGALAILFIALKLLGKIDWSWWLILAPLWIGIAIAVLVIIIMIVVAIAVMK